ncbi:MAG: hypothetical protein RBT34_06165 [Anaerolineaceae bacterium]|nr:hypothetical protein [Anaerolineaceae bacterium]
MAESKDALVMILTETEKAHQLAFAGTGGEDPEWPMWYADFMIENLNELLHARLTHSELICVLLNLSRLHPAEAPDVPWQAYYADYMIERYHV